MKTARLNVSDYSSQAYITRVYGWMFLGLLLTGSISFLLSRSERTMALIYQNPIPLIALFIVELAIVWILASRISAISLQTARLMFIMYAVLNGITLAGIFQVYTEQSIASTFFIAGIAFGLMSLYGYFTKQDLTKAVNILIMGLIGVIVASLVNILVQSTMLQWITTVVGILVFAGLTAADTQKLKKLKKLSEDRLSDTDNTSIIGALTLYLDLVNLILLFLRIFGRRRNNW